jgi:hypothetical protein
VIGRTNLKFLLVVGLSSVEVGGAVDQPGGVQLKNVSCEVADEERVDESLVPAVNRDCNRNTECEDDVQEFVVSERW